MKALAHTLWIAALVFRGNPAFAERAVEGTHVELDINSIDNDPSGAPSNASLGVGMMVTFPLGTYFGAALGGDYLRTRVRTGEEFDDSEDAAGARPSCSFDSLGGEAALMFRLPRYFRLSAGYSTGNLEANCTGDSVFAATGRDRVDTEGLRFGAEAYLGDFTLGVERVEASLGDGPQMPSTAVAASWYPLESLKLEVSGNDLNDAETYRLLLEHQLDFAGDGIGIRIGFSQSDAEARSRTIEIGLSYYFRKVPLKDRDRAWR